MPPHQRSNITSWIAAIIALVSLALSAGVFGQKSEKLDRACDQIDRHDQQLQEQAKTVYEMAGDIRVIRTIVEQKHQ